MKFKMDLSGLKPPPHFHNSVMVSHRAGPRRLQPNLWGKRVLLHPLPTYHGLPATFTVA